MQDARNVGSRKLGVTEKQSAQELNRHANVFFAIIEDGFLSIFAPTTFADSLCDRFFIDALPTFDAISATRIRQPFPRFLPLVFFVGVVRKQDVAGREIGSVQIEDVNWKLQTQNLEACHLRPSAIGDK